jgi:hypothetical protein
MTMPQHFFRFVLFALCIGTLSAQSVRWQPAGGILERGQATDLVLIFENCLPTADVALPAVPNLTLGPPQQSNQTSSSIINGQITTRRMLFLAYPARPGDEAQVIIPTFTVATDQGNITVPTARFEVREATVGDSNIPVAQVAQARLSLGAIPLWAGQVTPIDYQLEVSARFRAQLGGEPQWEAAPLVVEEWNEPTRDSVGTGGDARNILTYSTRGYINQPGTYVIPSVQQLVNIGIPAAGFLQSLRAEQYAITSDSPQIVVRPLPSPSPASFTGAVGDFELVSRVVPETAEVGEPVTWTLELTGTGNWPDIPGLPVRQASATFRVVQPDAKREIPDGRLFDGSITEDVVLIPTQAGDFQLGPVTWTYFDPGTGSYQSISTPATTLTVTASSAAAPVSTPSAQSGAAPESDGGDPFTVTASPTPESPSAIPLEVLPGKASSPKPLSTARTVTGVVALIALFPMLWLWLSSQHARRHDSGRPARLARRRLLKTLSALDGLQGTAQHPKLLAWQQDSAVLWQRSAATPLSILFGGDKDWMQLWREAERAMYAEAATLPEDWSARARQALERKRAPRFPVHRMLSPRHLFPVLAAVMGLWSIDLPAQATQAYDRGDFVAAEAAWRAAITVEPTDWIAHHNLALSLAQQNRWEEAGAHAAIAFVQHPRDPSTRWHLAYTLERSGYTPPVIGEFINPRWSQRIAQIASPAEWRYLLLTGVAVGVLGMILLLRHAYGRPVPGWRALSWICGLTSVAVMAAALFSIQIWGTTADHRAALTWQAGELRSIPTDLNSEQQTTPLAAGSLCRVEKSFLGWRQVSFPNGQTGWVRAEALVPLWQ